MRALVLSGGGSKGAYQVGVWKALKEMNINIDIVTGTSAGALNAAFITQGTYYKAVSTWRKLNMKLLFNKEPESKNLLDLYKIYGESLWKNGGMETQKIENIIHKALNKKKFFDSKIKFGLVTLDVSNMEPKYLTKEDMNYDNVESYLMASATCFPAFKMKEIDGDYFVDGGYIDNMPINLALEMGATEVIAVDLSAPGVLKFPKKKIKQTIITPNNKLSNFLSFTKEESERNIKLGYNDTMKIYGKLEGNKYSFKLNSIKILQDTYKDDLKRVLKEILDLNKKTEEFYRKIKSYENFSKITKKIEDKIFIQILETIAKDALLPDEKIYTHKTFNRELKRKLITNEIDKKIQRIYNKIKLNKYDQIEKDIITNPSEFISAIYLYVICED